MDDDSSMRGLIEGILTQAGHQVVGVRSAEEAILLCARGAPRVAIIDGLLPGMRGDELARRLRQRFPREILSIAFVSAFFRDMKSYGYLTGDCGVDLVLHKPILPADLKAALLRLPALAPAGPGESGRQDEDLPPPPDLAQLLADYLATVLAKVPAMRAMLLAASRGPGSVEGEIAQALAAMRIEAHRLRGSGASFGVPELSRLGGEIEELLKRLSFSASPPPAAQAQLSGLLDALGAAAIRAAGGVPISSGAEEDLAPPRLLLVDGPTELVASCAWAASAGAPIRVVAGADAELHEALALPVDVGLVALDRPELDGAAIARRLVAAGVPVVIGLGGSAALEKRVEAIRLGLAGWAPRPPDAEAALRLAREFRRTRTGNRVLALDDDRLSLAILAESLAPHAVDVIPCQTPEELFEQLETTAPTLVILDVVIPRYSGLELLRVLRADPGHRMLPVVVISSRGKRADRLAAFEAGADDFVQKPFIPEELAARVLVHLGRRAQDQREASTDPLTGAVRRRALVEATERALGLARRAGRTLAIAVLDWDVAEVRQQRGRIFADAVTAALASRLGASFRSSDVIARIGDGRFAVLLHDLGAEDARRLLATEVKAFSERTFGEGAAACSPRIRGALAFFPDVSGGALQLLAAAEAQVPLLLR